MNNDSDGMRPCPFCGMTAAEVVYDRWDCSSKLTAWVQCPCDARGPETGVYREVRVAAQWAKKMWNDRTPAALPGWIRVEDELPKDNKPVIMYSALENQLGCVPSDFSVGAGFYHEGEWSDHRSYPYRLKVTHWMPFPEPPESAPPSAQ